LATGRGPLLLERLRDGVLPPSALRVLAPTRLGLGSRLGSPPLLGRVLARLLTHPSNVREDAAGGSAGGASARLARRGGGWVKQLLAADVEVADRALADV